MGIWQVHKPGRLRLEVADRRQTERRTVADRRVAEIEVEVERRVGGRRFIERRAGVRRQLSDGRHPLA